MANITAHDAAEALRMLSDAAIERADDLAQYAHEPVYESSNDENDSDCPMFNTLYNNGGSFMITSMTNFNAKQFQMIWDEVMDVSKAEWKTGRGRKSSFKPKGILFMILAVLKHGGKWDFLGNTFNIKDPTFERTILKYLKVIEESFFDAGVTRVGQAWNISDLMKYGFAFTHFKFARYATDVTIQQAYRPYGNMEEDKKYFSGKHKLYGHKVEVSVLPSGCAIGCSPHHPGSVSDIDIMHKNCVFHKKELKKKDGEASIPDVKREVTSIQTHERCWQKRYIKERWNS